MPPSAKNTTTIVILPDVLVIGFSGHRNIVEEAMCRARIHEFLESKKLETQRELHGVSSVAAGADLLFTEACIQLNIPLKVLLPLPVNEFRKDFDAATWERAEKSIQAAFDVEIVGAHENRPERYYECGVETVTQCDLMLALWDGTPSRGMGGTADIVDFATLIGKPLIWMHSATGAKTWVGQPNAQALQRDDDLEFLNCLPDHGARPASGTTTDLARAWLCKLDANANLVAPQVRRLAAIPILCTSAAALVSAAAAHLHGSGLWLVTGAALGICASYLPRLLKIRERQALWARTRIPAEVSRSMLAVWFTPRRYEAVSPEMFPELGAMLRSLSLLKARNQFAEGCAIEQFKDDYLRERINGQIAYFNSHAARATRDAAKYKKSALIATTVATVLSVALAVAKSRVFEKSSHAATLDRSALLATMLFQCATIAGALLAIRDSERRARRYTELTFALENWGKVLSALQTWRPLLQVVSSVERALLSELLEWKVLMKNRKITKL